MSCYIAFPKAQVWCDNARGDIRPEDALQSGDSPVTGLSFQFQPSSKRRCYAKVYIDRPTGSLRADGIRIRLLMGYYFTATEVLA